MDDRLDLPALRIGIGGDAALQRGDVEVRSVAIIGVLDKDRPVVAGEQVDEAIAVALLDRGVHDDGAGQAVGGSQAQGLADEFLPAAAQSGKVAPSPGVRSEEHTTELQSLMRISYAVFCLKKKI